MRRRSLLHLLVALVAWTATACQVTLATTVDIGRDGSGRITAGVGLDAEALEEIGDPATAIRVDDLRQAGWQVEPPVREADGLTWLRASKRFAEPEQAAAIVAELNGPDGPFRDFRVARTRSLTRSRTTFTGVLDLSQGLAGLSDTDLAAALDDVDLGLDVEGLRRRFGERLRVEARAGLPGDVTTNAPGRDGGRAVWAPALGEVVQLEASSEALRINPAVPIAAGGALAAVLLAMVVVVRRRRRRA